LRLDVRSSRDLWRVAAASIGQIRWTAASNSATCSGGIDLMMLRSSAGLTKSRWSAVPVHVCTAVDHARVDSRATFATIRNTTSVLSHATPMAADSPCTMADIPEYMELIEGIWSCNRC